MNNAPQPLTDESIDALIEAARPALRSSIRASIEKLVPVHMFEVAKIPLPSGQQWQLVIAVMTEPMSSILAATALQGFPAMLAAFEKMQKPAAPPSGFSIPGA